MTKRHQHPRLSSVRLALHVGTTGLTWSVIYRTSQGRDVFDRRVSSGYLEGSRPMVGPSTVCEALEAALADVRARYGLPPAAGGPGAPGGGGGRYPPVTPGDASTVPLSVVRDDR